VSTITESRKAGFDLSPDTIIIPSDGVELSFNRGAWFSGPAYYELQKDSDFVKARYLSSDLPDTALVKYIEVDGTDYPFVLTTAARVVPVPAAPLPAQGKKVKFSMKNSRQINAMMD